MLCREVPCQCSAERTASGQESPPLAKSTAANLRLRHSGGRPSPPLERGKVPQYNITVTETSNCFPAQPAPRRAKRMERGQAQYPVACVWGPRCPVGVMHANTLVRQAHPSRASRVAAAPAGKAPPSARLGTHGEHFRRGLRFIGSQSWLGPSMISERSPRRERQCPYSRHQQPSCPRLPHPG